MGGASMRFGVIAEDWPSWAFALDAIGAKAVKTVMPIASNQIVQEVKETKLGGSVVSVKSGSATVESVMDDREIVLIQGSDAFVEAMWMKFSDRKDVQVFGIVPDDRRPTLCESVYPSLAVSRISHCQVGGVTRGKWKILGELRLRGIKSSPVKRVLTHILGSTEMGEELPSGKPKKGLIQPDQRIPSKKHHVRVAAPCCFAKPKGTLVERELTDKEMMCAYDIEEGIQTALSAASEFAREPLSRSFVLEAPVKVLYTVSTAIIKEVEAAKTQRKVNTGTQGLEGSTPVDESKGDQTRKRALVPDDVIGIKKTKTHNEKVSEVSQVATKNDDAPVNVEDWDIWSVNSYRHPSNVTGPDGNLRDNPARVMVCIPGTYSQEKHGQLFDALRKLLLRRVRRNATQGLLKYLRRKYGGTLRKDMVVYKKVKRKRNRKRRRGAGEDSVDGTQAGKTTVAHPSPTKEQVRRLGRDRGRLRAYGPSGTRSFHVAAWTQRKWSKTCPKVGPGGDDTDVELFKDRKVGRDALTRLAESSWWQWDKGSTLFFWRWPSRHRRAVRDGTKLFVKKELLPHYFKKMEEKLGKVRERGYVMPGEVQSLTGFFAVPKGDDDIRIVYDATACGLNAALWASNFALPTIDSVLQNADSSTWFSDIDLGEMFLNYFLDEDLRSYAGVDLRELGGLKWERWERTLMGFRPSPYICMQTFGWGESGIRGDRREKDNPLRWDRVKLNLPGDVDYNPTMPWVYKWDEQNGCLASDFGCYIDDIRGMGGSERSCRKATRRVASEINYLGQQDAARKRRPPSRTPGAWAGAMCFSKGEGLFVTCSQKKWDKAKTMVKHWHEEVIERRSGSVNACQMERDVGYLVHMSRTFPAIFPYLKGFYLTLNSWRKGRNDDGWKYSMAEWRAALGLDEDMPSYQVRDRVKAVNPVQEHFERPDNVSVVPRLQPDLLALMELFKAESPAHRLVRGAKLNTAKVVFGDASGGGFGSSWEKGRTEGDDDERVGFRFGTWDTQSSNESSNYRELRNLTETLELMGREGELSGTELFVFTDNSTAESSFAKGSSSSRKLFELVLRLRKLEMAKECKIHVSHVSGARMISQGSDGLSRGNMTEGVMRGSAMKDFVPINETALERHPKLYDWLQELTRNECKFLDANGWFTTGQEEVEGEWEETVEGRRWPVTRPGSFVWTPPPAAAGIAVEQLRRSRHKSARSTHVFVVPRLFTTEWRKQLHKVADVVLNVPAGHPAWPTSHGSSEEHQNLWNWSAPCVQCGNPTVSPKDLFCGNFGACRGGWPVCRRAWHATCYTASEITVFRIARPENDEGAEWKKRREEDRFIRARHGDMLSAPFQCDFCWFLNLQGRLANVASPADRLLMAYIRRVNLDIMWSREESTVRNTLAQFNKGRELSMELGLSPVPMELGPWPLGDNQGFQVALEILRASQRKGRNSSTYVQFDSIRKLRAAYVNIYQTGPVSVRRNLLLKGPRGANFSLTSSGTDSVAFRMFMLGCEKRMGRVVLQELGFTVEVVLEMLGGWDRELVAEDVSLGRKRYLIIVGGAFVVLIGGALRGGEVLLLEASELVKRSLDGKFHATHPHVVAPLMGRFKNETGERNMLLALASVTSSGIEIRKWLERLVILLRREGRDTRVGPAICDVDGYLMERWKINGILRESLSRIQRETNLIPNDIDVMTKYSLHRSARRGMYTRAREANVPSFIIEVNMRWSKVQKKSGSLPNLPMTELYLEISQILSTKLAFSAAL